MPRPSGALQERRSPGPVKIVCHSRTVLRLARSLGWLPGASYRNLRNIRGLEPVGLIEIEWTDYNFKRHLEAVKSCQPLITIARDVFRATQLPRTLDQAYELLQWAKYVVIVPKDVRLGPLLDDLIPREFILGYSVPSSYGRTPISPDYFRGRPVHLLGGRPDIQRRIAEGLSVVSLDVNRFTLDARYGDFFDGKRFRPHPIGGYFRCLRESIRNIERIWQGYSNGKRHRENQDQESKGTGPRSNKNTGCPELKRTRVCTAPSTTAGNLRGPCVCR